MKVVPILLSTMIGTTAWAGYVFIGSHITHGLPMNAFNSVVEQIKGNGIKKTETRKVPAYTKVYLSSAMEGTFTEGKPGPITIVADSNILPLIKTKVTEGRLEISIKDSVWIDGKIKVIGTTTKLSEAHASGASHVMLKNISRHPVKLDGSGASVIWLSGVPTALDIQGSGASKFELGKVNLTSLLADLSGASSVSVNGQSNRVEVELSGASNLKGNLTGSTLKASASGASSISLGKFVRVDSNESGASSISTKK